MKTYCGSVSYPYIISSALRTERFSTAKDAVKAARHAGVYDLYVVNYWNETVLIPVEEIPQRVEAGSLPKAFMALFVDTLPWWDK